MKKSVVCLLVFVALFATVSTPRTAYSYSPLVFQRMTDMPVALRYPVAGVVGSNIWVLGGIAGVGDYDGVQQSIHKYEADPSKSGYNAWEANVATLDVPRWGGTSDVVGNYIYWAGGWKDIGEGSEVSDDIIVFDTINLTTQVIGHLTTPQRGCNGKIIGDYFYIVGGKDADGTTLNTVEVFHINPDHLSGTTMAPIALPGGAPGRYSPPVFEYDNKLFIGGGTLSDGTRARDVFILTPATSTTPASIEFFYEAFMDSSGNFVGPIFVRDVYRQFEDGIYYAPSGVRGAGVYFYDPTLPILDETKQYRNLNQSGLATSYPAPRVGHANVIYDNKLFILGGNNRVDSVNIPSKRVDMGYHIYATSQASVDIPIGKNQSVFLDLETSSGATRQASISLENVTEGGLSTIAILDSSKTVEIPGVFSTDNPATEREPIYYEVATDAQYTGVITITLPYFPTSTPPEIKHWNGSAWEPVYDSGITSEQFTSEHIWDSASPGNWDTSNRSITFTVQSLSIFKVTEGATTKVPIFNGWWMFLAAISGVGLLSRRRHS